MSFTELPHRALIIICKIARELEKETGEKINLSDENLYQIIKNKVKDSTNLKVMKLFSDVEKILS